MSVTFPPSPPDPPAFDAPVPPPQAVSASARPPAAAAATNRLIMQLSSLTGGDYSVE
jgi:hypothetical protein